MEERKFGRSGHMSSVAIFGSAVLWELSQEAADQAVKTAIDAGINHFDVAPSYGLAEKHLSRWMPTIRDQIFLGCKTMERSRDGARAEMEGSLERLSVSAFDLYQLHAVLTMDELDQATAPGGALEGILAARDEGLTRFIGITTHGYDAPLVLLEALKRFDFDSVLFPYGFVQAADPVYRERVEELLRVCAQRNVGSMVIKSITRGPWGPAPHPEVPWYAPFEDLELIQQSVNFALSQMVTGLCTVSSAALLPLQIAACENLRILSRDEQEDLIKQSGEFEPLWKPGER